MEHCGGGPKRLETITNCINEWIFTTKEPERTGRVVENKFRLVFVLVCLFSCIRI